MTDTLSYTVKIPENNQFSALTKRVLVSFVMYFFDPLGLISHLTVQGNDQLISMQAAHIATEDWDCELPEQ